eukprot:5789714-Pleurochrysis_carterae.AAC.1
MRSKHGSQSKQSLSWFCIRKRVRAIHKSPSRCFQAAHADSKREQLSQRHGGRRGEDSAVWMLIDKWVQEELEEQVTASNCLAWRESESQASSHHPSLATHKELKHKKARILLDTSLTSNAALHFCLRHAWKGEKSNKRDKEEKAVKKGKKKEHKQERKAEQGRKSEKARLEEKGRVMEKEPKRVETKEKEGRTTKVDWEGERSE